MQSGRCIPEGRSRGLLPGRLADAIAQTPGGSKPATDNAQAKKLAGNNAAKVTEANKAGKATENDKSLKVTETGKSAAPKK